LGSELIGRISGFVGRYDRVNCASDDFPEVALNLIKPQELRSFSSEPCEPSFDKFGD
jgi:hypothetical protein